MSRPRRAWRWYHRYIAQPSPWHYLGPDGHSLCGDVRTSPVNRPLETADRSVVRCPRCVAIDLTDESPPPESMSSYRRRMRSYKRTGAIDELDGWDDYADEY